MNFVLSDVIMPEIARFYDIVIKMFFGDHPPPHFHAIYGEYVALVSLESCEVIEGDLPNHAEKLVLEWTYISKIFWKSGILKNFVNYLL